LISGLQMLLAQRLIFRTKAHARCAARINAIRRLHAQALMLSAGHNCLHLKHIPGNLVRSLRRYGTIWCKFHRPPGSFKVGGLTSVKLHFDDFPGINVFFDLRG